MKIKLDEIIQVKVDQLKPNEKNISYFRSETRKYFDHLIADIEKRGILVPLIAKLEL